LSLDNLKTLRPYLLKSNLSNQEIAFLVSSLQKNFTTNRKSINQYHSSIELISAYTAFYLPSNYKKARYCFDILFPFCSSDELSESVEITDVGCGPGTMSLAFCEKILEYQAESRIVVNLIDVSPLMLEQAKKIYHEFFPQVKLNIFSPQEFLKRGSEVQNQESSLKLLMFSNSFNEIGEESTIDYFKNVDFDFLLFLGVGTQNSFKNLLNLKGSIERASNYRIVYPCKAPGLECPMDKDDWCHQTIRVKNDPEFNQVSQIAKIDRRSLAFTFHLYKNELRQSSKRVPNDALIPAVIIQFLGKNKAAYRWRVCFFEQSVNELKILEVEYLLRGLSKKEQKKLESIQVGDNIHFYIQKKIDDFRIRISF
jgi:SAM-dependent methyltransferase